LSHGSDEVQASGLQPFARLRSAAGGVYSHAAEFLAEVERKAQLAKLQTMESRKPCSYARKIEEIKPLKMFQADPIYGGIFIEQIWRGRFTPRVAV
jgi:hypothetical protein